MRHGSRTPNKAKIPNRNGHQVNSEIRKWEEGKNKCSSIVALTENSDNAKMKEVLAKPLDKKTRQKAFESHIPAKKNQTNEIIKSNHNLDNTLKIIDLEISQQNLGYNEEVAKNMLSLFMKSLAESKANMDEAYQTSNWENLASSVHKLHGSTLYCGVPRVKEASKKLEIALASDTNPKVNLITYLYTQLMEEIENLIIEYKKFR